MATLKKCSSNNAHVQYTYWWLIPTWSSTAVFCSGTINNIVRTTLFAQGKTVKHLLSEMGNRFKTWVLFVHFGWTLLLFELRTRFIFHEIMSEH
jgi:hypothetical protein